MCLRINLFWIRPLLWNPFPRCLVNGLKTTSPKTFNSHIKRPPPSAIPPTPTLNIAVPAPLTPKAAAPPSKSNSSPTSPVANSSTNWSITTLVVQMLVPRPFIRYSINRIMRYGIPPQIGLSMSRFWESCSRPWQMRYIVILMRTGREVRQRGRCWTYIICVRLGLPRIRGITIILRRWSRCFCKDYISSMRFHYPPFKLTEGENE